MKTSKETYLELNIMKPYGVFVVLSLGFICSTNAQCFEGRSLTFIRFSGVMPETATPVFVYSASGNEESLIGACLTLCRELDDCAAVVVTYGKGHCQGIADKPKQNLKMDNDVAYFKKICMNLPKNCSNRWWALETNPGYHLHSDSSNPVVLTNITIFECYDAIFANGDGYKYRSAQWFKPLVPFDPEMITISNDAYGSCVLNTENRVTEPESYRVSNYYTFYIEDQCKHDYAETIERCSYEEYYDQTLKHVERTIKNYTKLECKAACELSKNFICRGFTWISTLRDDESRGICDVHSEDIVTTGSWLLRRTKAAIYYRRVTCLNISVICKDQNMIITYEPHGVFRGRIYVPGRGELCAAVGNGGNVELILPLRGNCDVSFAYGISYGPNGIINKTMAYAMLMIQNNPIIQASGDRWVRVGCSPKDQHTTTQVDATVAVSDIGLSKDHSTTSSYNDSYEATPAAASAVYGKTSDPVTMYVVRVHDDTGAGAVSLGEPLELRIETTDSAEVKAFHLVASSKLGDSSVLLLDSKGCPTGQVDFPQFTRTKIGGIQRLSARFKAFRFPTSHLVRFAIMIRFCENKCPQTVCTKKQSRAVRHANGTVYLYQWGDEVAAAVSIDKPEPIKQRRGVVAQGGATPCSHSLNDEIQLELEMLVDSRDILSADTLVRSDHSSSLEGTRLDDNAMVCIHELLLIALALAWLAVQIMLLLGCCVIIRRYRKLAELSMLKDYQPFDNTGFDTASTHRRVHWPDQNIDILRTS